MSTDEYINDLFALELEELQTKYDKPKDQRSLVSLRRYYRTKQSPAVVLERTLSEQFITKAKPTVIKPSKVAKPKRQGKLTICLGDAQIGYRGDEPFHDERAMELAQIAIKELQPDNVVFTGDMIDLPAQSKYEQRGDWQTTTQRSLDRYHAYLAQTRANVPHAKIAVVHGNHEARMDTYVRRDASALLGIRRANAERELSVLNLQYLVRYEELGVESVDGYPNASYWLEDNLKVTHGTNVATGGSNAAKYLREESESVIFGHTHRLELACRTIATRNGQRTITACSPGCLARTDGYVPGFNYSIDNQGKTVPKAENWQQGILIIYHTPEQHDIQPIRINENGLRINDKVYNLKG
jgi:predicted phosphodiesterase